MLFHALEIAALLAIAYSAGWLVGYVARRLLAARPARPQAAAVPPERLAAVTGAAAPVVAPPSMPAAPVEASPVAPAAADDAPSAPLAQPVSLPEPIPGAGPATRPGEPWAGTVRGKPATRFVKPPPPAPVHQVPPPPVAELDEDAAMRAIEGGWSRVGAVALDAVPELPPAPATPPPMVAKPAGLAAPRPGGPDALTRIGGLGALDEATLNALGIYHFDQVAGWTRGEIAWLEDNLFARGRISSESWQTQARNLAVSPGPLASVG